VSRGAQSTARIDPVGKPRSAHNHVVLSRVSSVLCMPTYNHYESLFSIEKFAVRHPVLAKVGEGHHHSERDWVSTASKLVRSACAGGCGDDNQVCRSPGCEHHSAVLSLKPSDCVGCSAGTQRSAYHQCGAPTARLRRITSPLLDRQAGCSTKEPRTFETPVRPSSCCGRH
jgi:hypothetical protein